MTWRLLLTFVAYVATAKFGLMYADRNPSATAVWIPSGVAMAALILAGWRLAPAVFAAAFVVNATNADTTIVQAAGIAVGNTLEAVVVMLVWRQIWQRQSRYITVGDAAAFVVAVVAGASVSASTGVRSLGLDATALKAAWPTWWIGDVVGGLFVAPAILVWARERSVLASVSLLAVGALAMILAARVVVL